MGNPRANEANLFSKRYQEVRKKLPQAENRFG